MKPVFKIGSHDYSKWVAELTPINNDMDSTKSGRNTLDGLMTRNKIADKDKWSVSMLPLSEEITSQLAKDLRQSFFKATLLDPISNRYLTKSYYCASRPFGVQQYEKTSGKTFYVGMSFNITEQ